MPPLWLPPLHLDIRHAGKKGASPRVLKEFLEAVRNTLRDDFHLGILHIAHISGEREMPCMLRDEITIRDPLHLA